MPTTVKFDPYEISHDVNLKISDPYDPTDEDHDFGWTPSGEDQDPFLTFDLTGDHAWSELRADIEASLPKQELDRILPESSAVDTDVQLLVSVRCPAAKIREVVRLDHESGGRWKGEVRIRRASVRSAVELHPMLIRTSRIPSGAGNSGLATEANAIIANGKPYRLRIDASEPPLRGALQADWENFKDSNNPWRKAHPHDLYHLDLDGTEPKVWLNSAYPNLKSSLHSTTRKGPEAMIRHLANALIAQSVWLQLFAASAGGVSRDTELDQIHNLDGWRGRVLEDFASRLLPEMAEEDRVPELVDRFASPERIAALISEAGTAVQELLPTYKLLGQAIRAGESS